MAAMDAEVRARYRALQQEADFALWRAREASHAAREKYAAAARGEGEPPTEADLKDLRQLESDAEAKYRELRDFLRGAFDQLAEASTG